jgi:hypothetical protein
MQFATLEPVHVRRELAKTPVASHKLGDYRNARCYVSFWIQPMAYVAGRWQGGETVQVKRTGENEFKLGSLPAMTLEQAARRVEEMFDRYNVPYHKTAPWEHPYTYDI